MRLGQYFKNIHLHFKISSVGWVEAVAETHHD